MVGCALHLNRTLRIHLSRQYLEMTQRIVVVGSGFAGTWGALAARRLIELHGEEATSIEVTVVSPEPVMVIRPRLYEENPASMGAPLAELFQTTGVNFVKGTVDNIRTQKHELDVLDSTGARSTLSYDRLVLAAGSRLVQPNIPGLREHAFNIDQIENAADLDAHLHKLPSLPQSHARNTVVVCGGGFTGIEIAAELPARLRTVLGKDADVRVVVVDRSSEIGPELGPGPRPVILQALTEMGVELKLGTAVTAIEPNAVIMGGERIEAQTIIWTAGMEANALTKQIPGEKDRIGRLHVDADLRVPTSKEVFATGDTAFAATDDKGHTAMMSCQHALRLGRSAGYNAAADLLKIENRPYSQVDYGTCLDLGPWGSVITAGWDRVVQISGSRAKPVKQYVNGTLIYPPKADKTEAFALADPDWAPPDLSSVLGPL